MIKFYHMTQAQYNAITPDTDYLYFITDSRRLYKGTDLYTESFEVVTTNPTSPRLGCLYINTVDKSVKYYNGNAFVTVVPAIVTSISSSSDNESIPTAYAVQYAIQQAMSGVGGDLLTSAEWISPDSDGYESGDRTLKTLDIDNEPVNDGDMILVEENGTLYQYDEDCADAEDLTKYTIIAPQSGVGRWKKMLTATTYDDGKGISTESGAIEVLANEGEFTFDSSTRVMSLNEVSASKVVVSKTGGTSVNLATALNGKMSQLSQTTAGNILQSDSSGNAVDNGNSIGGESLAEEPNGKTVATELAVSNAISNALNWNTVS